MRPLYVRRIARASVDPRLLQSLPRVRQLFGAQPDVSQGGADRSPLSPTLLALSLLPGRVATVEYDGDQPRFGVIR
jgi:hypothetical protein